MNSGFEPDKISWIFYPGASFPPEQLRGTFSNLLIIPLPNIDLRGAPPGAWAEPAPGFPRNEEAQLLLLQPDWSVAEPLFLPGSLGEAREKGGGAEAGQAEEIERRFLASRLRARQPSSPQRRARPGRGAPRGRTPLAAPEEKASELRLRRGRRRGRLGASGRRWAAFPGPAGNFSQPGTGKEALLRGRGAATAGEEGGGVAWRGAVPRPEEEKSSR